MRRRSLFVALTLASTVLVLRAADWEEPKDGLFTEKQLLNYIAAQKELIDYAKAAGKAAEGGAGAALAVGLGIDGKLNAIVTKNGMQLSEYAWVAGKVGEAMGVVIVDGTVEKAETELAAQKKKNAADIAAAQAKITALEAAAKSGARVLTAEQREELIKQAREQQNAALEEAKTHTEEAKTAAEEAAKAETEAKAADALAKKPPADVEADAKADYINGKKEEATNLRNSAKEARDREKEARKLEAEGKARAAAFAQQIAHPEIPITPEEKEQVKNENERALNDAKTELDVLKQATTLIADSGGNIKKQFADYHKTIKEENLALVKKHLKAIQKSMGIEEQK